MTDRELLETAANAAGIEVVRSRLGDPMHGDLLVIGGSRNPHHEMGSWNPLTDDGDALRLAVKLRLSVSHHNDSAQPHPWLRVEDRQLNWTHAGPSPEFNANPYAATRRAIVRAAAEIGKAMNA